MWRLSERMASFLVLPSASLRSKYARPSEWRWRTWQMAAWVQGVVQPPVPPLGDTVDDPATGGSLDRGGAVVGREAVAAGEAGDIAGEADQVAGDDGSDTEQLGEGGPRCRDGGADTPVGFLELFVEALHVGQKLEREVMSCGLDRGAGNDALEERDRIRSVEFFGDPAR
jgi:hypothetical protein